MKSIELRELWEKFWESDERTHVMAKPTSLIVRAADDPTTMFNTAGMQQFVPYLMGKEHPLGTRLYNIQGCVRTTDIDDVGDISHLTYFEMMGNWSLGDYFKQQSIERSRQFLTSEDWLGLNPNYIAVSVFEGDENVPQDNESIEIWKSVGIPESRVATLSASENRWGPAGATGPCGPDSEIYYWIGEGEPPVAFDFENDEDNWLEVWNNVFMSYNKDEHGHYNELEQKNVDTGMGFERLCMVLQCVDGSIAKPIRSASLYDTDMFVGILDAMGPSFVEPYPGRSKLDTEFTDLDNRLAVSYRIIADHIRTSTLLISEGLTPSNEGRGYVLRRIIRRMYYHMSRICLESEPFTDVNKLHTVLNNGINSIAQFYSHIQGQEKSIVDTLQSEIVQFQSTISHGVKKIEQILDSQDGKVFSGDNAFLLYDTYGVPIELTQEIMREQGMTVDMEGFEKAMQWAQEKSRQGSKQMFAKDVEWASYIDDLPPTKFVGYEKLSLDGVKLLKDFEVQGQRVLVFDQTPMYAESGGQAGDRGTIIMDDGEELTVNEVHSYGGVFLHFVG